MQVNIKMKGVIIMEKLIYGVSSKFEFGTWNHVVYRFQDKETAEAWLHTEEYDFREREIMDKEKAIALTSEWDVENAKEWELYVVCGENGTIIDRVSSVIAGEILIDTYERIDREENNYTKNFYDIVDCNYHRVARCKEVIL